MSEHTIKVVQVFKVTRTIYTGVEGQSRQDAISKIQDGFVDIPPFEDQEWKVEWELQNEEVT